MAIEIDENNQAKKLQKVNTQLSQMEERMDKAAEAYIKCLKFYIDVENELDQKRIEEKSENVKRRKPHSFKNFEFQGLSYRAISEDLNLIYEGIKEEEGFGPENFKRNDAVSCIVDRKKYKGTIVSVNQRGMVIKTQDRRKIKLSWEEIEDGEAKVTKLQSDDE
ncbi:uncharacterized protein VICG_01064 [Vittaforma corneae ATCC 50505]|uniref:Uncharacterized protein n=1 Tax=Vittaforma corneae (strain ATCC 50505) TaxID=993615 RepID=L2GMZ9_VITCO|nr:uncharacterized protein VICG_01064 [Vittaforma corneae ATCC 50505]ELA41880.1 hypothetical protein VICG_01064 [Vittaforma corneae ATCC 50505]